ncbi:hypothetical protein FRC04_005076 [Tulasnella sp. 424]|nr:hypothetical protein FRC04_005076 [Tulasnella sp. 424]
MHAKHILAAFATIPLAHAAVWNITVGGSAGIVFTPNQVTAAVGDTLHFIFGPPSHSATQGTFDAPCTPMPGGFNSGFVPIPSFDAALTQHANPTRAGRTDFRCPGQLGMSKPPFILHNVHLTMPPLAQTDPIWVHCQQVGHCPAGMLFAANAPSSGQTFAAYQAAAMGKSSNANTGGSSSSATAAAASTTGSTSSDPYGGSGPYGNDASALELNVWMVGVAAFIGAAAMI